MTTTRETVAGPLGSTLVRVVPSDVTVLRPKSDPAMNGCPPEGA